MVGTSSTMEKDKEKDKEKAKRVAVGRHSRGRTRSKEQERAGVPVEVLEDPEVFLSSIVRYHRLRPTDNMKFQVHLSGCRCNVIRRLGSVELPDNGFVVVPKHKSPAHVLVSEFCESRPLLDSESALNSSVTAAAERLSLDHVLLTGATCLLQKSQRNCSVIIFGAEEVLDTVVQVANEAKEAVSASASLEPDHADHVVAIRSSLLRNGPSERGFNRKAKLKEVLLEKGVPVGEKFLRFDFRITEFYKLSRWNNLRFEEDETLLVSVIEKKNFFLLSLPGGKRELGETCFDCGLRETQEETSLVLADYILGSNTSPTLEVNYTTCLVGESTKFMLMEVTSA